MAELVLSNQGFEYVYEVNASDYPISVIQELSWDYYLDGSGTNFTAAIDMPLDPALDPPTLDGTGDDVIGSVDVIATSPDSLLIFDGYYYMLLSNTPQTFPLATTTGYNGTNSEFVGPLTPCFARGTRVATPEGERLVEDLAIGDRVNTAEGPMPVKWLGCQTRHVRFAKQGGNLPVCIKAGALGDDLPTRDLYVSPDHAMLVDGVLVHALALVNGASIVHMTDWPRENVEYFHIELANHELVYAEGALSETFVDNVTRKTFDNWREYEALYGAGVSVPELALPRIKNKRQLSTRTRSRLMAIAVKETLNVA